MSDTNEEIKLSDISEIGQPVPKGHYKSNLSAVNGKLSKAQPPAPMVEAVFDILEGEHEGMTLNIYHSLKISQSTVKNGPNKGKKQNWAPGIQDMKAACAAVGAPIGGEVSFKLNPTVEDAQRWAVEYGKRLHPSGGPVEIAVIEEPRRKKDENGKWVADLNDDGSPKMTTRGKVVGRWKGAGTTDGQKGVLEGIGLG